MRITSTYVENTDNTTINFNGVKDHLHIRGEYKMVKQFTTIRTGSPPHTWRIQLMMMTLDQLKGITSTYVENTWYISRQSSSIRDHLHIRGEYS